MKRAAVAGIFVVLLACVVMAQGIPLGSTWSGSSSIPADYWFQINTSSPGTNLTTGILSAAIVSGHSPTFSLSPASPTTWQVAAAQSSCAMKTALLVNGTTYPTSSTEQSFALTDSTSFVTFTMQQATGGGLITSAAGCIILGPPTSGFQLYDYLSIYDGNGRYTVFPQLSNGAGSNYRMQIETAPGGVTTHDGNITVTSGSTYWFTVQMNESTKTSTAALYTYPGGVQVGSTLSVSCLSGGDSTSNFNKIVVGNNENGNGTGTTYFQTLLLNLSGTYPLGP